MKIRYLNRDFSEKSQKVIDQANVIIAEYAAQGFKLTLRQLFYQFVSRDLITNTVRDYKRLGGIVNDGRLAGLIDWEMIEDRTRNLQKLPHWENPADIVSAAAQSFHLDYWVGQPCRVEVWIEKEALSGVFEGVCHEFDIPFFCCRGYTSQSEVWEASRRLNRHIKKGQPVVILYFGDHDPSGLDMSRDIADRLETFRCPIQLRRLALNHDQIQQYDPPPNPAKSTDSRYSGYTNLYGEESWELDALEPAVLADLVRANVTSFWDKEKWDLIKNREEEDKKILTTTSDCWDEVVKFLTQREEI